jgi:hypothetical protein
MGKKRKQAMSSAEAQIGNVVGIDPHKRSLSAAVLDHRGGLLGCRHFPVSAKGHQALETWVLSLGPVLRWGIEGPVAWAVIPAGGQKSESCSGGAFVDVVQASEDRPSDHLPVGRPMARDGGLQTDGSMGSVLVVVGHELGQHRSDMPLAQRQDVVQALAT